MLIIHVHVHVKTEFVEAFRAATVENARNSVQEAGILRFDVIQQNDDPERFILVEIYRDVQATDSHKQTAHYKIWRDAVAPMMAEPRTSAKFSAVFPPEEKW
jgi:(4S)-4-hydroxy-5-phosphonooxypentane-2,3-dione isomerase